MQALEKYNSWVNHPDLDNLYKQDLEDIANNQTEIEDRFYRELSFGTAGLRGILGAGTNRMNHYNVARATVAYANYLLAVNPRVKSQGIAISYDSRLFSADFAQVAARAFLDKGIKVYLSDQLRPVPFLAYAVRHYRCAGGVMITASHNPKDYNGFKVFGPDGAQIPIEVSDPVAAEIDKITDPIALYQSLPTWEEVKSSSQLNWLDESLDRDYFDMALDLSLHPETVKAQKDLKIAYTPLHGTGNKPVQKALAMLGFENVLVVKEQAEPDGEFPTVPNPNPEEAEALLMGIELMEAENCEILLATDPDGDRLGVVVRDDKGQPYILSGNQIGVLLMDYLLGENPQKDDTFVVSTVVSSKLADLIAQEYGAELFRTLTGFKNMVQIIEDQVALGKNFRFAYEESFGYLVTSEIRDKDAISASMFMAELAAFTKNQGESIYDRLQSIYKRHGYTAENTVSFNRTGRQGQEAIARTMAEIRAHKEDFFSPLKPRLIYDYLESSLLKVKSGESEVLAEDKSNVLVYELDGLDWFACRPSGTEPKIKIYLGTNRSDPDEANASLEALENIVISKIKSVLDS